MANKYEAAVVLSVAKSEEETLALKEKFNELIAKNGTVENVDDWGKRRLAYLINDEAEGYYVTVLYFWLNSPDLAVKRVKARVAAGGHNIPEETVRRRYRVGINYFFNDYAPICDRWILADNSKVPFKVVAEGGKARPLIIKDSDTFEKIKGLVSDRNEQI